MRPSIPLSQLPRRAQSSRQPAALAIRANVLRDESNAVMDESASMLMDVNLAGLRSPPLAASKAAASGSPRPKETTAVSKRLARKQMDAESDLSAQLAAMDDAELERTAWEAQAQKDRLELRQRQAPLADANAGEEEGSSKRRSARVSASREAAMKEEQGELLSPLQKLRKRLDSIGPSSRRQTIAPPASLVPVASTSPIRTPSTVPTYAAKQAALQVESPSAPTPRATLAVPQERRSLIPRKSGRMTTSTPSASTKSEGEDRQLTPSPKKRRLAHGPDVMATRTADAESSASQTKTTQKSSSPENTPVELTPRKLPAKAPIVEPKSALRKGTQSKGRDGPRPSVRFVGTSESSPLPETQPVETVAMEKEPELRSFPTKASPDSYPSPKAAVHLLPTSESEVEPSSGATDPRSPTPAAAATRRKAAPVPAASHTSSGLTVPRAFNVSVPKTKAAPAAPARRSGRTSNPPIQTPVLTAPLIPTPSLTAASKNSSSTTLRKSTAASSGRAGQKRLSDVKRAAKAASTTSASASAKTKRAPRQSMLPPPIPMGYRQTSTGALVATTMPSAPLATTARRQKLDLAKEVAALAATVVETRTAEVASSSASASASVSGSKTSEVPTWLKKRKAQLIADEEKRLLEQIEKAREAELRKGLPAGWKSKGPRSTMAHVSSSSATVPAPSAVEARLAERAARVLKRKAQDELMAAAVAEAREERERIEAKAYREERKRTVPKANPVPDFIRKGKRGREE